MWLCWDKGPGCPLRSAWKKGRWEDGESSSGLSLRGSQGDQPRLGVMAPDFTDEMRPLVPNWGRQSLEHTQAG